MPKVIDESRIFEAATALFVRHGFAGATTKAIAEAAGVNEATLFRRYGSKKQLLERAIDHQWRDVPLATLSPSDDVEEDLVAIVEAYLETNRLRGAIIPALLVELARSTDLRGAFGGALANISKVVAVLRHHQSTGSLRSEEPLATLTALVGPLLVQEMFRRAGIGPTVPSVDPRAYIRAFLEGRMAR
jgi:AcrR family transcriptional regulator